MTRNITSELRINATRAYSVENALDEFTSAKVCNRLQETGLLQQPLVVTELAKYERLYNR